MRSYSYTLCSQTVHSNNGEQMRIKSYNIEIQLNIYYGTNNVKT
jgi:hypothetical protein